MKNKRSLFLCSFFVVTGVCLLFVARSAPTKPFDSSTWKRVARIWTGHGYPGPTNFERAQMVSDLLARHVRLGMSRTIVHTLLGSGDVIDGSGENGTIDVYRLVNRNVRFRQWQSRLWWRYGTDEPTLSLEYDKAEKHLINISMD